MSIWLLWNNNKIEINEKGVKITAYWHYSSLSTIEIFCVANNVSCTLKIRAIKQDLGWTFEKMKEWEVEGHNSVVLIMNFWF